MTTIASAASAVHATSTAAASAAHIASNPSAHLASAGIAKVASAVSSVVATASSTASVTPSPTPDAWLNGFATLVGALVGALAASWIAYKLQLRAAQKKEREAAMLEAHQMMFSIVQQTNTILLVWKDYFAEQVASPARFMNVPAITPFDLDRHVLDLTKMTIMLDRREGRAILYELNVAQESYRETLFMLNERSKVHREQLQSAVEKAGIQGVDLDFAKLEWALGKMLLLSMIGMTDNTYSLLHKTFMKLSEVKDKARQYIVDRFNTDDFTRMSFDETFGIEQEPVVHYQSVASRAGTLRSNNS